MTEDKFEISDDNKSKIEHWLAKFPQNQRRSAVVAALLIVQEQNNHWLSEPAMIAVAEYLGIPPIEVFEVATFYDMYELKPRAKNKIGICTNVSCMLRGADKIIDTVKQQLGIGLGETTEDGLFTLREMECMAACCNAPMCQINDKEYCTDLTPDSMWELIERLKREK